MFFSCYYGFCVSGGGRGGGGGIAAYLESSHCDSLCMLSKPPWGQVSEDHGEPVQVDSGLLLGVGRICQLEALPPSPENGLPMALLQVCARERE